MSDSDDIGAEVADRNTGHSEPSDTKYFTRRAALKLGIFSLAVGVSSAETVDVASADSDGYGLGGYGEGPYGDPTSLAVSTDAPTNIEETAITLNGKLSNLGDATSADVYFEWGKAGDNLPNATGTQTLSSTGAYSERIEGLSPGVEYEYRAVAEDDNGTNTTGTIRTVTTDSVLAISTDTPMSVDESSATLAGTLSDLGGASSVDVYFEWDKSGETLSNETDRQTVSSTTEFNADITGLASGTEYVYRAMATASDGDSDTGNGALFTTDKSDSAPVIDSYTVTEAGKPNPHATLTADWDVSDVDGDLESVVIQVYDSDGNSLDSARTAVNGGDATGSNKFEFKKVENEIFSVRIQVADVTGNTAEQTQIVTE